MAFINHLHTGSSVCCPLSQGAKARNSNRGQRKEACPLEAPFGLQILVKAVPIQGLFASGAWKKRHVARYFGTPMVFKANTSHPRARKHEDLLPENEMANVARLHTQLLQPNPDSTSSCLMLDILHGFGYQIPRIMVVWCIYWVMLDFYHQR